MVCVCPTTDQNNGTPKTNNKLPAAMICFKVPASKTAKRSQKVKRVKKSKSRELRAGILYIGCDCEKRNGLQDDCPRSDCHGAPPCLVKPDPICGPSEFAGAKHLIEKTERFKNRNKSKTDTTKDGYECFPIFIIKE